MRIVIGSSEISALREAFRRTWLREPTPDELAALIRKTADEEILAREAVAMGLDRDDAIVRRHLRLKLESTISGAAQLAQPTERDLEDFLRSHADRYGVDPRISFRHVFLSAERRGERVVSDAARLLEDLRAGGAGNPAALGDPTLLPAELRDATVREIENTFGAKPAAAIAKAPVDAWSGPIRSEYGLHLVHIDARTPARPATLSEARDAVRRDWEREATRRALDAYYAALAKKYAVVVEPRPGMKTSATGGAR